MKEVILLLIIFFLLTSCGSENKSTATHGDETGNIDIVDYLPTTNMIKTFSYADHRQILFSASGVQEITVNNNTIKIIQKAHAHRRFNTGGG